MHFLALCTLVILVAMANIGYANGSTCQCSCCRGFGCNPTSAGSTTVASCSSCVPALCQSTYSSTCVPVNGATSAYCAESNDAHTLFEPIYGTLAMIIMSFSILIYQKIKW
jgi:hypothetical protein